MHLATLFLLLTISVNLSTCRDFYLGMFKKNDLLVAQDTFYKPRIPFRFSLANYGRKFHCPITYIRVEDRLNVGRGPRVQVIRGGLRKKYVALRLTSPYNNPISVNIYVGCENKKFTNPPWTIIRPTKPTTAKPNNVTTMSPDNATSVTGDNATDVTTQGAEGGGEGGNGTTISEAGTGTGGGGAATGTANTGPDAAGAETTPPAPE